MDRAEALATLKKRMKNASDNLEFEKAAELRDMILKMSGSIKNDKAVLMKTFPAKRSFP